MKRIAIMGCSGSGKSTLARALGVRLGLPVYHLDAIFWQPGWVESDFASFTPKVQEILDREEWIIDGGYSKADPDERRYKVVDALILFDRSRWLCLWRAIMRVPQYWKKQRPDMGVDCPEKVDPEFLVYIWNYKRDVWPLILERAARNKTPVMYLHKDPDVEEVVAELNLVVGAQTSRANL